MQFQPSNRLNPLHNFCSFGKPGVVYRSCSCFLFPFPSCFPFPSLFIFSVSFPVSIPNPISEAIPCWKLEVRFSRLATVVISYSIGHPPHSAAIPISLFCHQRPYSTFVLILVFVSPHGKQTFGCLQLYPTLTGLKQASFVRIHALITTVETYKFIN